MFLKIYTDYLSTMITFIYKFLLLVFFLSNIHCTKATFSLVTSASAPPPEILVPVAPKKPKKVDILVVIDNSLSMVPEHPLLAEKLKGFSQNLKNIDYRIAVTTTDAREIKTNHDFYSKAWAKLILRLTASPLLSLIAEFILFGDSFNPFDSPSSSEYVRENTPLGFGGKALSFNGQNFISPKTPNGENLILTSLDRSLEASCDLYEDEDREYWEEEPAKAEFCANSYEEPVKVIKQFLRRRNIANTGFLRDNTPLAVLIITDEDLEVFEHKNMDMAEQLKSIHLLKPNFKAYGVIAQKYDSGICQPNWSGISSTKVQEFITLSGGSHNSICDTNYTSIFDKIVKDLK